MIPVNKPYIGKNAKAYVADVLSGDWLSPSGPYWRRFRNGLVERFGANVVMTNSGTSALEVALRAVARVYGKSGGKIVVPGFTCPDVAVSVIKSGFTPIYADVHRTRMSITAEHLKQALSRDGNSAIGVILVHQWGMAVDPTVYEAARAAGLFIVDDQAEGLGARPGGFDVLSLTDVLITSLRGDKPLPVGGGGLMLTKHAGIYGVADAIVGMNSPGGFLRYHSSDMPLSYEFPEIMAAVGLAQLEDYDDQLKLRRDVLRRYEQAGLASAFTENDVPWKMPLFTSVGAMAAWTTFRENGVEVSPPPPPLYTLAFLGKSDQRRLENCEMLSKYCIALPIYPSMSDSDLNAIVSVNNKLCGYGYANQGR